MLKFILWSHPLHLQFVIVQGDFLIYSTNKRQSKINNRYSQNMLERGYA